MNDIEQQSAMQEDELGNEFTEYWNAVILSFSILVTVITALVLSE